EVAGFVVHFLPAKIHVDKAFVDLDHAVLQPRGDAQFFHFDGKGQRRLHWARDGDAVEFAQATQRGDDDGAGTGKAYLTRDVALIADREIAVVQRQIVPNTVFDELLDCRLDQPHAAVVSVQFHVAD